MKNARNSLDETNFIFFDDRSFFELTELVDDAFLRDVGKASELASGVSSLAFWWANAPLIDLDEARATFDCQSGWRSVASM